MRPSDPRSPTQEQTRSLVDAITLGFGGCTCAPYPHRNQIRICPGHEWLLSDPTRRGLVKTWQRLLFYRSQRDRLLREEGRVPTPVKDPVTLVLPW